MVRYQIVAYGPMPITLSEAKLFLKVDTTADDSVITNIIEQVVMFAEAHTSRELRPNQWYGLTEEFESVLTKNPVSQIAQIDYIDENGSTAIVPQSSYQLKKQLLNSRVILSFGGVWPTDVGRVVDPIRISFSTSAHSMLPIVKQDMLRHIAWEYENRGDDSNDYDRTRFYLASAVPNV
jgi:uncharacterized phiE125 gp8 family phage protein